MLLTGGHTHTQKQQNKSPTPTATLIVQSKPEAGK